MSASDGSDPTRLALVGKDLTTLEASYGRMFGATCKELDLNFNCLRRVNNLEQFEALETLNLDNNELESAQIFPFIPTLKTLWANNNKIEELEPFLLAVKDGFPNLAYLSLLKNSCCPHECTGRTPEEYKAYRLSVLYHLPQLKFLDATKVTTEELMEARRAGRAKAAPSAAPKAIPSAEPPAEVDANGEEISKSYLSFQRYHYLGKESEGNRFIGNSDL
eukprot:CAMPEP_0114559506 /NCGR_PEP_ID=MMETSP0114-20121206/10955_1 /TAXON_ID=31324 /ORGANISM="Goniomonas sp, Strain m" /LENGTH=219 /DNA_ID=CAMNT_0001744975 /DNA_START=28 /DNA_END=687 /DNA_ORIENTATION=+